MRCARSYRVFKAAAASAGRRLALGLVLSLAGANAWASTAGTLISNTASLRFEAAEGSRVVASNTVTLLLAERLDVTVVAEGAQMPIADGHAMAVGFRVTNSGNGPETFDLTTQAEGATVLRLAIDANDDGIYDPAIDLPVATVALDAGGSRRLFVLAERTATPASVALTARAQTGTGIPGTVFVGQGQGGSDAVTGTTEAIATARVPIEPLSSGASLIKSQIILAPDGTNHAVKSAVITYVLEARFTASAEAAEIVDAIPAGTAYVAGSLMLDGHPLSDAADADAGRFDGTAISVALGAITAGSRTIQFQTTIQ